MPPSNIIGIDVERMSTPTMDCPDCSIELAPSDIEKRQFYSSYYCGFCEESLPSEKAKKVWEQGDGSYY